MTPLRPATPASTLSLPPPLPQNRWALENGLTVLHLEDGSCGLASVQIWVKTGSIHEGALLGSGLSHYLEHMLFKGTGSYGPGVIAERVQAMGGYINAYTTFDRTVYHIDLPAENTPEALDILYEMAFEATLSDADIAAERSVILREIDMGLDDPDRQLSRAAFRNAFRVHPYRLPVIGHRPLFEAVSPEQLRSYYRERYTPNNIVVVVAGAVDRETLEAQMQERFATRPTGFCAPAPVAAEPPQLGERRETIRGDVTIGRGVLAFRIPSLSHPDAPGLDMVAGILGGGRSSRLWKSLREERNLVHHVDSMAWNPGTSGLLWVTYVADVAKMGAVETAVHDAVGELCQDGVTLAELEKARRQAVVGEINSRKTVSGQAARLGLSEVVVGDLDYRNRYLRHLEALEPKDLTRLARHYLRRDQMTAVAFLPREKTPKRGFRQPAALSAPPVFEERTLSNGARILLNRDPRLPKVHFRFAALGGALYEPAAERGLTTLLATLLTRDTAGRTAAEVAEMVENIGGAFHEYAGNNAFGFSLEVLRDDVPTAIDLMGGALFAPAFDGDTFSRERAAQIAQIEEDMDEIVEVGEKCLRRHFFGDHPFAIDPDGTPEMLRALTAEHLRRHHRQLLCGANTVLAVSGDFDEDALAAQLENLLTPLSTGAFSEAGDHPYASAGGAFFDERVPKEQAVLFNAFPDAGIRSPSHLTGTALQVMLNDMSGDLFRRVREEQSLAYFVGANRMAGIHKGMFFLYGGTHPETADRLLKELRAEVERLRDGRMKPEELTRAQARLRVQKRMALQSISARAAQASLNALYRLPVNDWLDFDDRVSALTPAVLQAYVEKWWQASDGIALRVGP
ncbi:MAG: insulinase family protein [Opitutales bacterium]|nr:insulinase family protein [Opitutales bacterium]